MILVLEITGLERHLCTKAMDRKNKKISKILDKYKSSFSSSDLSSLEELLSNDLSSNEYSLFSDGACEFDDDGKCKEVKLCGDAKGQGEGDCLSENEERAWSSPIFIKYSQN